MVNAVQETHMDQSSVAENEAERTRLQAVVAAADIVDRRDGTLLPPIIEAILVMRPRSLTWTIHRRQHLDQIEHVLAG
jgi:hypothetical protein